MRTRRLLQLLALVSTVLAVSAAQAHAGTWQWTWCQEAPHCNPPGLRLQRGTVQTNPSLVAVFWGSWWKTPSGAAEAAQVSRLMSALPASGYARLLRQYYGSAGQPAAQTVSYGGSLVVTGTPPTSFFQSSTAVASIVASFKAALPQVPVDSNTDVIVFPAYRTTAPDSYRFCQGAHGSAPAALGSFTIAYVRSYHWSRTSSCTSDGLDIFLLHEWAEMVTDPFPSPTSTGWTDNDGNEIVDLCAFRPTLPIASFAVPGSRSLSVPMQGLYSLADRGCATGQPTAANRPPLAGAAHVVIP